MQSHPTDKWDGSDTCERSSSTHQLIVLETGVRLGDRDDPGPPSRPKVDDALRVLQGRGNSLLEVPKVVVLGSLPTISKSSNPRFSDPTRISLPSLSMTSALKFLLRNFVKRRDRHPRFIVLDRVPPKAHQKAKRKTRRT